MTMNMVWLVIIDDGNSQEAEIDIDSIWTTNAEANTRARQVTGAYRVWTEGRRIGEIGTAHH